MLIPYTRIHTQNTNGSTLIVLFWNKFGKMSINCNCNGVVSMAHIEPKIFIGSRFCFPCFVCVCVWHMLRQTTTKCLINIHISAKSAKIPHLWHSVVGNKKLKTIIMMMIITESMKLYFYFILDWNLKCAYYVCPKSKVHITLNVNWNENRPTKQWQFENATCICFQPNVPLYTWGSLIRFECLAYINTNEMELKYALD